LRLACEKTDKESEVGSGSVSWQRVIVSTLNSLVVFEIEHVGLKRDQFPQLLLRQVALTKRRLEMFRKLL